ncbi:ras gtpase-activating protein [Anaeramoeba flamelloides]|uniref:Ras gtpase-activating protein n=2 Tax=Anaeramoeba flamelloides TaxID=1746091 RepID=A0AAV7Z7S0_9EUKA|nr:ras gtpase-activating protein [Anaeramoeba flamelloides]
MSLENEPPQLYCKVIELQNVDKDSFSSSLTTNKQLVIGCVLQIEKLKLQTSTQTTLNLTWNEEFLFLVKKRKAFLNVNVLTYPDNRSKKGNLIGFVKIEIEKLMNETPKEEWFTLESVVPKSLSKSNSQETMKMMQSKKKIQIKLKVHFTFTKKYLLEEKKQASWRTKFEKLIEILVSDNFKLLLTFSDLIHSRDSDQISDSLISVLRNYNQAMPFLFYSIAREVSKTKLPQQLFGKNSMARNMITNFSRQIGKNYITSILKKPINEVIKQQEIIQIYKLKIGNDEYEKNIKWVEKMLQKFLDAIVGSIKQIPEELKTIFSHVSTIVEEKFQGYSNFIILSSLISRFICPAIHHPNYYGIIEDRITKENKENLRLISKILQTFVSTPKLIERNELFSEFKNWSDKNIQKINGFVNKIVSSGSVVNKNEKKKQDNHQSTTSSFQDLIDFRNFLYKYFDRIDVLHYEPQENEKKESSMTTFLKFNDPCTRLAIILNQLKDAASSTYKKSHDISNKQIKKQKAIKITQSTIHNLEEDNLGEDELGILNQNYEANSEKRKATKIAEELLELLSKLRENNIQDKKKEEEEIKQKQQKKKKKIMIPGIGEFHLEAEEDRTQNELLYLPIDWKYIGGSTEYLNGIKISGELKNANLNELNLSEKLAFWINIANCLFLHACIISQSNPETFFHIRQYNVDYKYSIDGLNYSREDIIQGILKGNKKYFSKKDPRRATALTGSMFVSYALFAVTNLQLTSPKLFLYHGNKIDKELFDSCGRYLKKFLIITKPKSTNPKIIIPTLFKWNKNNLGGTDSKIFDFILSVLSITDPNTFHLLSSIRSKIVEPEYKDIFKENFKEDKHELGNIKFQFIRNKKNDKEILSMVGSPRVNSGFKK